MAVPVTMRPNAAARGTAGQALQTHATSGMRQRAGDILGRFKEDHPEGVYSEDAAKRAFNALNARAISEKMTLTAFLEREDPTDEYEPGDPMGDMDAFERQMALAGIHTKSDHSRGIYASPVTRFYESNQPASPILYPEWLNRNIRTPLLAPAILDELVAVTTPIDGSAYRAIYLNDTVGQRRMMRVPEGSPLPEAQLLTAEHAVNLYKYGVRLKASYESVRRMRLDLLAIHIGRIGLQAQLDKASDALNTLINGDGNGNAATNYRLHADLDASATAGTLTYYAWLKWLMQPYPYQITTVVGGQAELLSVLTLQMPNINPMTLLAMLTEAQGADGGYNARIQIAQDIWTNVRLVYLQSAPSGVLLGFNKGLALEMLVENGSSLVETDKLIVPQFQEIAVSEVVGFDIIMSQAVQSLTLTA